MVPSSKKSGSAKLPEGYIAIPLAESQKTATLRIAAVARTKPDPVGGHLVILRDTIDARVVLGCILDAGGRVHRWVEIWIQNLDGLAEALPAYREALTNTVLDDRWRQHFQAFQELDEAGIIETGWETAHSLPIYLDLSKQQPVHPADADSKSYWELCQDDDLLAKKNLPKYGASLHRYLYTRKPGKKSSFVPVTREAPTNANTKSPDEITGDSKDVVALNPGGGLMLVRLYSPIGFETLVGVLSGVSWEKATDGRATPDPGDAAKALRGDDSVLGGDGRLFLGPHGRWGRLLETFHLKLRLLIEAISSVRGAVARSQQPLLNITPDSFQVRLGEPGRGLPFLWTARTTLIDHGDAMTLPVEGTDVQYFLRATAGGASIYQPQSAGESVRGRGSVRVRKVIQKGSGPVIVEGTLQTQERVSTGKNDLVWLRLALASGPLDLYAHLDVKAALASGEWRFRTLSQKLSDDATAALHAAEGVPVPDVSFEVIPLLSSPCDLYALGVLAARTLLVNKQTSLPVALDEVLSLAQAVASEYDPEPGDVELSIRIKAICNRDPRWVQSLGPQRLAYEGVTPGDALDLIPAEVWWSTLAMIVRMFPGAGPDSVCQDYGDAQPGGIHKVFDRAIHDLEALLVRTRSLIVIDWRFNREIRAVIGGHLTGVLRASQRDEQGGSPGKKG